MDTIKFGDKRVKMIAHRGLSGLERENTAAAFVAAGNRPYFGVETDVHRTREGQFVIIHDDTTTRVADTTLTVEETDLAQLRQLRLKDMDGCVRGDLCLPTLKEYVRICKKYAKVCVLELKNAFAAEDIARIVEEIREEGWLEETIFISFELSNLVALRAMLPHQRAQYLVGRISDTLVETLIRHNLDLDIAHNSVTAELVQQVHAADHEVNVWTVDTLEDARRVAECGVDYITSNILE